MKAEARLRISESISALLPVRCAENRDYTERKKDRAKDNSIPRPRKDCAEQRQGGEQARSRGLSCSGTSRSTSMSGEIPFAWIERPDGVK